MSKALREISDGIVSSTPALDFYQKKIQNIGPSAHRSLHIKPDVVSQRRYGAWFMDARCVSKHFRVRIVALTAGFIVVQHIAHLSGVIKIHSPLVY